jgi:hypothetical protein
MSAKVYVVQKQHKWDEGKEEFVPKFDLSSAEEYGELVYLLKPTAAPFHPGPVVEELRGKLEWFNEEDSLLLIGNPVLIGCAVAIASQSNRGRVKVLQWSGTSRKYVQVQLMLNS